MVREVKNFKKKSSAGGSFFLDRLLEYEAKNTVQTARWGLASGTGKCAGRSFKEILRSLSARATLSSGSQLVYPFLPTIQQSVSGGIDLSGEMLHFLLVRLKP